MYANHPAMAKRWSEHTPAGAKLPTRVHAPEQAKQADAQLGWNPAQEMFKQTGLAQQPMQQNTGGMATPAQAPPIAPPQSAPQPSQMAVSARPPLPAAMQSFENSAPFARPQIKRASQGAANMGAMPAMTQTSAPARTGTAQPMGSKSGLLGAQSLGAAGPASAPNSLRPPGAQAPVINGAAPGVAAPQSDPMQRQQMVAPRQNNPMPGVGSPNPLFAGGLAYAGARSGGLGKLGQYGFIARLLGQQTSDSRDRDHDGLIHEHTPREAPVKAAVAPFGFETSAAPQTEEASPQFSSSEGEFGDAALRKRRPPILPREESLSRPPRKPRIPRDESLARPPRKPRITWAALQAANAKSAEENPVMHNRNLDAPEPIDIQAPVMRQIPNKRIFGGREVKMINGPMAHAGGRFSDHGRGTTKRAEEQDDGHTQRAAVDYLISQLPTAAHAAKVVGATGAGVGGLLGLAKAPQGHGGEGLLRGAGAGVGALGGGVLGGVAGTAGAAALGMNPGVGALLGAGFGGVGGYRLSNTLMGAPSWEKEQEQVKEARTRPGSIEPIGTVTPLTAPDHPTGQLGYIARPTTPKPGFLGRDTIREPSIAAPQPSSKPEPLDPMKMLARRQP